VRSHGQAPRSLPVLALRIGLALLVLLAVLWAAQWRQRISGTKLELGGKRTWGQLDLVYLVKGMVWRDIRRNLGVSPAAHQDVSVRAAPRGQQLGNAWVTHSGTDVFIETVDDKKQVPARFLRALTGWTFALPVEPAAPVVAGQAALATASMSCSAISG